MGATLNRSGFQYPPSEAFPDPGVAEASPQKLSFLRFGALKGAILSCLGERINDAFRPPPLIAANTGYFCCFVPL